MASLGGGGGLKSGSKHTRLKGRAVVRARVQISPAVACIKQLADAPLTAHQTSAKFTQRLLRYRTGTCADARTCARADVCIPLLAPMKPLAG